MDKVSPNFLIGKIIKPCGFKIEVRFFGGMPLKNRTCLLTLPRCRKDYEILRMSKLFRIFTIAHKLIIHKSKEPERIKKTRVIRPRLKKQKTLIENFKTNIMKKAFCILVLILMALSGIYTASAQSGGQRLYTGFRYGGRMVENIQLSHTQEVGQVELSAGELFPGAYTYSLLVSGKVIDSKRMVVTE